jgi:hypothetical protein
LIDFNEAEVLSPTDVAFMVHCCLSAAFKVYSISADIDTPEITGFVKAAFPSD